MPSSKWENIGPKQAAKYLQRNNDNRPHSSMWSDQLADAMSNGEYHVNGETIKFNCDGGLADGQHRLHAIVKSGTTQRMLVVRGVAREAFDTLDQGKKRSVGDVFARRGELHYVTLATAVRYVYCYENGWPIAGSRTALRSIVAVELLERHPLLRQSVAFVLQHDMRSVLSTGYSAGMHYFCSKINARLADEFWAKLGTGESLTRGEQVYILRKRLLADRYASQGAARLTRDQLTVFCIKSWNAVRAGRVIKTLKWSEGEEYPRFK